MSIMQRCIIYIAVLLSYSFASTHQLFAQERHDWKYYHCPKVAINEMELIQYGDTREDVYLGTKAECADRRATDTANIKCLPLIKDNIINTYIKHKEIFDELNGQYTLIENPTVYSTTVYFHVNYLFNKNVIEPITFYVFHSPDFCRGGWIDIERNSDGSAFLKTDDFEDGIYYMSMTTERKRRTRYTSSTPYKTIDSSKNITAASPKAALPDASGVYSCLSDADMYQKISYIVNGNTSVTAEFTSNFIKQTNNFIPQIVNGSYCVIDKNPNVMIFFWAFKDEIKFSVFRDVPNSTRKDKRDAIDALRSAKVAETKKCNVAK